VLQAPSEVETFANQQSIINKGLFKVEIMDQVAGGVARIGL